MGQTRDVVFVSEVSDDEEEVGGGKATGLAERVRDELVGGLREFFGVEAKGTVLGEGIGVTSVVEMEPWTMLLRITPCIRRISCHHSVKCEVHFYKTAKPRYMAVV